MTNILESLSLGSGALVVAVASALVTGIWAWRHTGRSLWIVAIFVPLVSSYALYWAPVWLGSSASEYSGWFLLIVGAWYSSGFFASILTVIILGKARANHG